MKTAVLALSSNDVLGITRDGKPDQPFKCNQDFAWFKRHTIHKAVVMGRKTFEAIQWSLPDRTNFIVSSTLDQAFNTIIVPSVDFIDRFNHLDVVYIGGVKIFEEVQSNLDAIYLTRYYNEVNDETALRFDSKKFLEGFKLVSSKKFKDTDKITNQALSGEFQIWERM